MKASLQDTDCAGSRIDVIDRFMTMARRQPDAPAVVCNFEVLSYGDLDRLVRLLATQFATRISPCVLVALPPGGMAYAAMLAASLAGGYYVPVNACAPAVKLQSICALVQPDIIIGTGPLLDILCQTAPAAMRLDAGSGVDGLVVALGDRPAFLGSGTRHDLAYMIFTSGSTGTPKGVVIARSALDHYVGWTGTALGIGPGDRVSQYANIAFDLSVLEIYATLCHGGSLHPPSGKGDRLMPAQMVAREQLTVWISVPSVVALMMHARQLTSINLASLRRMVFCGEPLLEHQVAAIFGARPDILVQNTYGPTEATVSMTSVLLTRDSYRAHSLGSMAIGEPIAGMTLSLEGGRSPDEGEIVLSGPQLARGYFKAELLTEQAFRTEAGLRRYHTGDWAERRGGRLYHRGRIDFQVKIRGYRIELDEVAVAIAACGYPNACVFKHDELLVAVVETAGLPAFGAAALRRKLSGTVDAYAVPGLIEPIDLLPRNGNDKIDRDAVLAWFQARVADRQDVGLSVAAA